MDQNLVTLAGWGRTIVHMLYIWSFKWQYLIGSKKIDCGQQSMSVALRKSFKLPSHDVEQIPVMFNF